MSPETPEVQFARLFEALQNPIGIFVALAILVLLTILASGKRRKWALISLLLFFAPMMIALGLLQYQSAVPPFHQFRTYGRPVCGALLVFMLIPAFNSQRGWRRRIIFFPAMLFLIFELIYSARTLIGGAPLRGTFAIVIYLLTFAVFSIGLPKWLQDLGDLRSLLRAVAAGGLLMSLATVIQLMINSNAIIAQRRLTGLTGNPQQLGLVLAASFPVVAALAIWKGETKPMRVLWAALAAVLAILLAWTGSRTGAMMTLIGLGILFRRHIGAFFGFAVVCAVLVLVAVQILEVDVGKSSERLLVVTNTRAQIWGRMFEDFLANPMVGVPREEAVGSENSYLVVAAQMGLVGLLPLAVVIGSWIYAMFKLHAYRKLLREQALLVDLVLGGLTAFLVAAAFEGFLIGTITHQGFMIYMYLAVLAFLLDVAEAQARAPLQAPEEFEEHYEALDPHLAHGVAPF